MAKYGEAEYWEERYARDAEPFDWYQGYRCLKPYINQAVPKESAVLMVGCGSSRLSEDMAADGYDEIVNIDVSETIVRVMQERAQNMSFYVMDMRKLEFTDEEYDAVIDKGTLDTLLCMETAAEDAKQGLMEISRVLKPQGVYFMVSYGAPDTRLPYLEDGDLSWSVSVHKVEKPEAAIAKGKPGYHYIYICQKGGLEQVG
uniref:Methyltransferase domain-containing protein n=1 Tax=Pinguiococcus pyrenoidosus TaxID=172671 RepID=A0A7R9U186_9STRA|mmetsp:Transcript_10389/g.39308  ORF Transcript_10389/g.39308 Transcript_10389/m.39308 type:complete len:201 (+) Transcript_10389:98-700(+)